MATKNVAAKAAPKAEAEKLTAGQKAAATKKANAKAAESTAKPAKAAAPAKAEKAAKAVPIKLVKSTDKEVADVKPAPPKAVKAKVAKAAEVVEVEPSGTIGRKELADRLRIIMMDTEGVAVTPKVATALVVAFELAVTTALQEGTEVVLPGFGKFKVSMRAGGTRRNPSTGESFESPASLAVGFKVGKALKDAVNDRPV